MGFIALIIEFFEISIHEVLAPESCTIPCVIAMLHDIRDNPGHAVGDSSRSEEHTSELQSLMRISYAVFCLKKKTKTSHRTTHTSYDKQSTHKTNYTDISTTYMNITHN